MTHSLVSITSLPDHVLLRDFDTVLATKHATSAALLAHLAEIDARQLFRPAAYPSMCAWCVGAKGMTKAGALKRIRVARTARKFPAVLDAVAAGKLQVSAVVSLAAHLTPGNADDLLAAAAGKTREEIEQLLVARCPRPDVPTSLERVPLVQGSSCQVSPGTPSMTSIEQAAATGEAAALPARVTPLAPERFALQVTIDQETRDLLEYAQSLSGHAEASRGVAHVLRRALQEFVHKLEQRKFGATSRPGRRRSRGDGRSIPAEVKRAVWQRDGGQCTFVSESGHRCECRDRLEFDHILPVARGGRSTTDNVRLRCRPHNQFEAERTFGAGFMEEKRAAGRARSAAAEAQRAERAAGPTQTEDVIAGLQSLGYSKAEARWAAARSEAIPHRSLEARFRYVLKLLAPASQTTQASARSA